MSSTKLSKLLKKDIRFLVKMLIALRLLNFVENSKGDCSISPMNRVRFNNSKVIFLQLEKS